MAQPDSLDPEEKFQAVMNIHGAMLMFQNSYYLAKEGTLDREIHQSLVEIINGIKNSPGFTVFWQARKSIFLKDFQDYVERIVAGEKINSQGIYQMTEEN